VNLLSGEIATFLRWQNWESEGHGGRGGRGEIEGTEMRAAWVSLLDQDQGESFVSEDWGGDSGACPKKGRALLGRAIVAIIEKLVKSPSKGEGGKRVASWGGGGGRN